MRRQTKLDGMIWNGTRRRQDGKITYNNTVLRNVTRRDQKHGIIFELYIAGNEGCIIHKAISRDGTKDKPSLSRVEAKTPATIDRQVITNTRLNIPRRSSNVRN